MKRARTETTSLRVAQVCALAITGALGLAVFYHGPQMPLLAGAQILLVSWLVLSLTTSYRAGISLPLTPLSISLTLFWFWLAISILWSAVPVTSTINFWWVGSLIFVFWCYLLSPEKERLWRYVARTVLAVAIGLCVYAMLQFLLWHERPRSTFVNVHSFGALIMLIAIPLCAHFLQRIRDRKPSKDIYWIAACLFFLFFTIASTEGRGTTLSLGLSLLLLAALSWRIVGTRSVLVLFGVLVGAYIGANLILHGGFSDSRLATLADPGNAGYHRFSVWRGSWEMLKQNPWWGVGLGTYYLAFPPYRDPTDSTLGFFAHNDYLQIWIEAGLPALLFLLAALGSAVLGLFAFLKVPRVAKEIRLEATGLFCGLLAVALHSFLDFNLYILPISIVAGLILGRFHTLVFASTRVPEGVLRPAKLVQPHAYRVILVLLALFPFSYFIALAGSDLLYKRGYALAAEGKIPDADMSFTWAERLLVSDDKVLMMHADLYRHVLTRLPKSALSEREPLYKAAVAMLDEAESANPYRPLVNVVRGRLFLENPDLSGPEGRANAETNYAHALALDPRFFSTRMAYAGVLLLEGRDRDALRLLEGGMPYWYYPSERVIAYYRFTAGVAKKLGETGRASEIELKITEVQQAIAASMPARPVVPDLNQSPTAGSA